MPGVSPVCLAQEWLTRRLHGLTLEDFEGGLHLYCTAPLVPPRQFAQAWTVYRGQGSVLPQTARQVSELQAIIIFCSPTDDEQIDALRRLVQAIDNLGHDAPPILWVPHTAAPDSGAATWHVDVADRNRGFVVTQLLELGLDGMIAGEPEGIHLALTVRSKLRKLAALSRTLNDIVNERRSRTQYSDYLKDCIDIILWEYLRVRLAPAIPAIDYNLPAGEMQSLDGYDFVQSVGSSNYGSVYKAVNRRDGLDSTPQIMKVVAKAYVRDVADLATLRRQIEIMTLVSSEQWAHPNLVQLFQTYHSTTHLYFRMEWVSSENLFRRLCFRDVESEERRRTLSLGKCVSLLKQVTAAVAHMHTGPSVCHRDIKPENFLVQDSPESDIIVKLTDFDLSCIQQPGSLCRSPCGTLPFTAPEVLLQHEYDGMAADVWSLGIVMLEVLRSVRCLEQLLSQGVDEQGMWIYGDLPSDGVAHKVRSLFQRPGAVVEVLNSGCRNELRALLPHITPIVCGMLVVIPQSRWMARQVAVAVRNTPPLPDIEEVGDDAPREASAGEPTLNGRWALPMVEVPQDESVDANTALAGEAPVPHVQQPNGLARQRL